MRCMNVRNYFMNRILPIFTVIGAIGYLIALSLYLLTFWKVDASTTPVYSPLTFLLYATWMVTIFKLVRDPKVKEHQKSKSMNPITFFKVIFNGTPVWVIVIAVASWIFGMISFAYLMNYQPGIVDIIDGKKVLQNHGSIIKELSNEEYKEALAIQSRQFIGHYLVFFGVGTAILWPDNSDKNKL